MHLSQGTGFGLEPCFLTFFFHGTEGMITFVHPGGKQNAPVAPGPDSSSISWVPVVHLRLMIVGNG